MRTSIITREVFLKEFKSRLDTIKYGGDIILYPDTEDTYSLRVIMLSICKVTNISAEKFIHDIYDLVLRKNSDYSSDYDAYANFKRSAKRNVSVEMGILTRIDDKISRHEVLSDKVNSVKEETIIDTLIDLFNYTIILDIYTSKISLDILHTNEYTMLISVKSMESHTYNTSDWETIDDESIKKYMYEVEEDDDFVDEEFQRMNMNQKIQFLYDTSVLHGEILCDIIDDITQRDILDMDTEEDINDYI